MTICIAAIAESKEVIGITDKKYTVTHGIVSAYEITENKKIIELTPNCIALFAGNIVNANEILQLAKPNINSSDTIADIALKIQTAHNTRFRMSVDQQILAKHGLDLDAFNAQQRTLDTTFVSSVVETINKASLGVEILIAGKNGTAPQLIRMMADGALEDDTSSGYVCIGSGSSHAKLSLIESSIHSASNKESVLYALMKAKRYAEYDPNVGKMSDIVLINDEIRSLGDSVVKGLWAEFDKSTLEIKNIIAKSNKEVGKLAYGTSTK